MLMALFAAACGSAAATQVLTIKQRLPDQESLAYNLVDDKGTKIGSATVSIQRDGDSLVLRQNYTDLQQHTDSRSVTVEPATLKPQRSHRELRDANTQATVDVTYAAGTASAVANDGHGHRHQATVTAGSYDDQEVFFLMRTLEFTLGYTAQFGDVVVANDGTINRATASVRVNGTTNITVGGKSFKAWEVQLTAAGATSTAWYDTSPGRRLLRYANARRTAIELANP